MAKTWTDVGPDEECFTEGPDYTIFWDAEHDTAAALMIYRDGKWGDASDVWPEPPPR